VYADKLKLQGWDELTIKTSDKFSDLQQAFAAGYLEGALMADKIWLISRYTNKKTHPEVHGFFDKQDQFLRKKMNETNMASMYIACQQLLSPVLINHIAVDCYSYSRGC